MISSKLKVYLRRDPQNYKEAWAFKADNEEFVGKDKKMNNYVVPNCVNEDKFLKKVSQKETSPADWLCTQEYIPETEG